MTRALIDEVMAEAHGRMLGDGIWYPDLREILEGVQHWDQWFEAWTEMADRYERLAEEALARGFRVSAGEYYWRACMHHHYAQFLYFAHPAKREAGQRAKEKLYRKAAPLLVPAAERLEIPIDNTSLPAYLRLPPGTQPAPCAILIGGLESTKEESYGFENLLLRRGVATLAFDGPGQGEMWFRRRMQPDFERYTSRIVDYLETRPEIDARRIGVLGRSLGGYYAARSAAFERRLAACVCWGCIFRVPDFWDQVHPATQDGLAYVCGAASHAEARERLRMIDLTSVAARITCPLYIFHGRKDWLIPVAEAEKLRDAAAKAPQTVVIPEDAIHCGHNISERIRTPMADWLAHRLGAQ
jgi:2,6-dihydroxypseudooxynicotine hydrolase